jgi:hypothetical protein
VHPCQYGASPDSAPASALLACEGISASARLSLRTEFARTLQKTVTLAALTFFDLPFSGSYFDLTSCPSTRTWSPSRARQKNYFAARGFGTL